MDWETNPGPWLAAILCLPSVQKCGLSCHCPEPCPSSRPRPPFERLSDPALRASQTASKQSPIDQREQQPGPVKQKHSHKDTLNTHAGTQTGTYIYIYCMYTHVTQTQAQAQRNKDIARMSNKHMLHS